LLSADIPVKFFENMEELTGVLAECIVWIPEIHVDAKYEHSLKLAEILRHERRHYDLLIQLLSEKSVWRRCKLRLVNNLWDFCSSVKFFGKWFLVKHFSLGE
jgi:hypothetical protein